MIGDEWLNIQDIFAIFIGPWVVIYMGLAVAGAVCLTALAMLWQRLPRVQVISQERERDD
jgi:hypothetical protein